MHFLAQSSPGTNAEAITDNQHPDHQLQTTENSVERKLYVDYC
jgi:hypothetical protein